MALETFDTMTGDRRREITEQLRKPFEPHEIKVRIDGAPRKYSGSNDHFARVVLYVKRSAIEDRLDDVFGFGGWSYDWIVAAQDTSGDLRLIKSVLTLLGHTYNDAGVPSKQEVSLGCVSRGLKRVASEAGLGRYLAYLPPTMSVPVTVRPYESKGKSLDDVQITPLGKRMIALFLERWDGKGGTAEAAWERAQQDAKAERGGRQTTQAEPQQQQTTSSAAGTASTASAARVAPANTPQSAQAPQPPRAPQPAQDTQDVPKATEAQRSSIRKMCATLRLTVPDNLDGMSHDEAAQTIGRLSQKYREAQQQQRERAAAAAG